MPWSCLLVCASLIAAPADEPPQPSRLLLRGAGSLRRRTRAWSGAVSPRTERGHLVARLIAPVLWFSPDEPLLEEGAQPPCSASLRPASRPRRRLLPAHRGLPARGGQGPSRSSARRRSATSRPVSSASSSTTHTTWASIGTDTTSSPPTSISQIERLGEDCYQVRLKTVVGHAHGVEWYWNELTVMPDTALPSRSWSRRGSTRAVRIATPTAITPQDTTSTSGSTTRGESATSSARPSSAAAQGTPHP